MADTSAPSDFEEKATGIVASMTALNTSIQAAGKPFPGAAPPFKKAAFPGAAPPFKKGDDEKKKGGAAKAGAVDANGADHDELGRFASRGGGSQDPKSLAEWRSKLIAPELPEKKAKPTPEGKVRAVEVDVDEKIMASDAGRKIGMDKLDAAKDEARDRWVTAARERDIPAKASKLDSGYSAGSGYIGTVKVGSDKYVLEGNGGKVNAHPAERYKNTGNND